MSRQIPPKPIGKLNESFCHTPEIVISPRNLDNFNVFEVRKLQERDIFPGRILLSVHGADLGLRNSLHSINVFMEILHKRHIYNHHFLESRSALRHLKSLYAPVRIAKFLSLIFPKALQLEVERYYNRKTYISTKSKHTPISTNT